MDTIFGGQLIRVQSKDCTCKGCFISNLCAKLHGTKKVTSLECTDYEHTQLNDYDAITNEYIFKWSVKPDKYIQFSTKLFMLIELYPAIADIYIYNITDKKYRRITYIKRIVKWGISSYIVQWRHKIANHIVTDRQTFNKYGISKTGYDKLFIKIKY